MTEPNINRCAVGTEYENVNNTNSDEIKNSESNAGLYSNKENYDPKAARGSFSRIGFALLAAFAVTVGIQFFLAQLLSVLERRGSAIVNESWVMWIVSFAPLYLAGIPVGLLILRGMRAETPRDSSLGAGRMLQLIPMAIAIMYIGNYIGTILSSVLSGGTAENGLLQYAFDDSIFRGLVFVILAPLVEEFLFRKQLIDRSRHYGERTAIVLSAVTFGLFHANFFQFFYAFGLGLLFAYIYTRTGRLRYSVMLHMFINFLGGVLAPWIIKQSGLEVLYQSEAQDISALMENEETMQGIAVFGGYVLLMIGIAVAGVILLILRRKKVYLLAAQEELPKGKVFKTVYLNPGMILFILFCAGIMVYSLI